MISTTFTIAANLVSWYVSVAMSQDQAVLISVERAGRSDYTVEIRFTSAKGKRDVTNLLTNFGEGYHD